MSFDWEKVKENLEKKLLHAKIQNNQRILYIESKPKLAHPIYYSASMINKMNGEIPDSLLGIPDLLNEMVQMAKEHHDSNEKLEVNEIIVEAFREIQKDLERIFEKFLTVYKEQIVPILLPKEKIYRFLLNFSDGIIFTDEDLLKNLEKTIWALPKIRNRGTWAPKEVKRGLEKVREEISKDFLQLEESMRHRFNYIQRPDDKSLVFPSKPILSYHSVALSEDMKTPAYGSGVQVSPGKEEFLVYESTGRIVCRNIQTNSEVLRLEMKNDGQAFDLCKFSKQGTFLSVVLCSSKTMKLFSSSGSLLKELNNIERFIVPSALGWIGEETVVLGFSDGSFRAFDVETGALLAVSSQLMGAQVTAIETEESNQIAYAFDAEGNIFAFVFSMPEAKKTHLKNQESSRSSHLNSEHSGLESHKPQGRSALKEADVPPLGNALNMENSPSQNELGLASKLVMSTGNASNSSILPSSRSHGTKNEPLNSESFKRVWYKEKWHTECICQTKYAFKLSRDQKRLASSGDCDTRIKLMALHNQSQMWVLDVKMRVWSILWAPGDSYLLAMGYYPPKLVAVSPLIGQVLVELRDPFRFPLVSMSLHCQSAVLLVGDTRGNIHKVHLEG